MNVNQAYCGDHSTIYTHITSLRCTPKMNAMFYANFKSITGNKKSCALLEFQRHSLGSQQKVLEMYFKEVFAQVSLDKWVINDGSSS